MVKRRKLEYAPGSLTEHINRIIKEQHFNTRIEAMEEIARQLDRIVRKRRNKLI